MPADFVIEQAVATSLVYLIRSLGNIWGVTITSSIVQNVLSARLPEALKDIRHRERVGKYHNLDGVNADVRTGYR
jgi:predicted thioredoxin/glutaredoxin